MSRKSGKKRARAADASQPDVAQSSSRRQPERRTVISAPHARLRDRARKNASAASGDEPPRRRRSRTRGAGSADTTSGRSKRRAGERASQASEGHNATGEASKNAKATKQTPASRRGRTPHASSGAGSTRGRAALGAPSDVIAKRVQDLERRIDQLLDEASRQSLPEPEAPRSSLPDFERAKRTARRIAKAADEAKPEFLSSEFYARQWGRLALRHRSDEVDEFGYDPAYESRRRPILDFLHDHYFRVATRGQEHLPALGRCIIVANHSGALPYDGLMLRAALRHARSDLNPLRWLAENFSFYLPFVGTTLNRLGAVRACPENAERLLKREALVGVFPEGVKGIGKLYGDRYRLQRFGRGGFIKLALRMRAPIVPCAIIGAEESAPMLLRVERFARLLGVPFIPITPTFPLLGPLGLLPAPTKWFIQFDRPLDLGDYGPEAADDELLVSRLTERVRATIQAMIDRQLGERRSVFFG